MYITIKSINKTLGKYIEMKDLYIGIPCFMFFLLLFSIEATRTSSLIFLTICIFLLIPINVSKKNRMYKVLILVILYILKPKKYYFIKDERSNKIIEKIKKVR